MYVWGGGGVCSACCVLACWGWGNREGVQGCGLTQAADCEGSNAVDAVVWCGLGQCA